MGLQLIFVVETNRKCKSDWIYIKDTIDWFYQYDQAQVKLSTVYMNGKGNYKNKEKEISSLISQYGVANKENQSKIIFCFDCDDYDVEQEDSKFLSDAQKYCRERDYDFVWFCKDIERVYVGKKVDDNQKKRESAVFKAKKLITTIDADRLTGSSYQVDKSNIMNILDRYIARR